MKNREMTKEEMQAKFDETVEHLAKQQMRATLNHQCRYRTPYGEKCAAGFHIKDEDYNPRMEGLPAIENAVFRHLSGFFGENGKQLIKGLQVAHDSSRCLDSIRENLFSVATTFGLSKKKVFLIEKWTG